MTSCCVLYASCTPEPSSFGADVILADKRGADKQASVHRMHHDPSRIQLCTLMNIKSESAFVSAALISASMPSSFAEQR